MSSGVDSKQDYGTPKSFINAVEKRFGPIAFDLAASKENAKAKDFYTIEDNSLEQDWTKLRGNLWLNPPYKNIGEWTKKCMETIQNPTGDFSKAWRGEIPTILLLVPASVGSNWFRDYVQGNEIHFINPRITFDGAEDPYPRDCMLVQYSPWDGMQMDVGYCVWEWKK